MTIKRRLLLVGASGAHLLQNFATLIWKHHLVNVCPQVCNETVYLRLHSVPLWHILFFFALYEEALKVRHHVVANWQDCVASRERWMGQHGHVIVDDWLSVHVLPLVLVQCKLMLLSWRLHERGILLLKFLLHLHHCYNSFIINELLRVLFRGWCRV